MGLKEELLKLLGTSDKDEPGKLSFAAGRVSKI